jgi:hypothetical protein
VIVDFVVCTLTVKKKKQGRFRHVGSDHSLVSRGLRDNLIAEFYQLPEEAMSLATPTFRVVVYSSADTTLILINGTKTQQQSPPEPWLQHTRA